jgi:membrane-associated phospholipid phosphatase
MKAITWVGSWVALLVTGVIVVALVVVRRLPVIALAVATVAWAGEELGVRIDKGIVQRARPPKTLWLVHSHGSSFASGHVATAGVVFTILTMLVVLLVRQPEPRIVAWMTSGVAVVAVGFSRVELGVHWTTDVIASVVFVSGWLMLVWFVLGFLLRPVSIHRRGDNGDEGNPIGGSRGSNAYP